MKRILAVLLAALLLIAAVPATSLAEGIVSNGDTKVYHAQTNGSNLMLRREPGTTTSVISSLPNGTALAKISSKTVKKNGFTWINVKTMNGIKGWVADKYVRENARADINTQKDGLRVRSSRNASSTTNILYSIPHGTKGVLVYKTNGNWAYVSWNGKPKGWAFLSYLKWARW